MTSEASSAAPLRPVPITELFLNYSPIEDRIVWAWRGPAGAGGAFWLTRPLLARLSPPLLACLREPRPPRANDPPWPAHLWTANLRGADSPPALVRAAKVFSALGGLRLDLELASGTVRIRLPQAQLAPLLQHLKTLSARAGWGWQTASPESNGGLTAPASPTLH